MAIFMSIFNKLNWNILRKNSQNGSGIYSPTTSQQTVVQSRHQPPAAKRGIGTKLIWIAILTTVSFRKL